MLHLYQATIAWPSAFPPAREPIWDAVGPQHGIWGGGRAIPAASGPWGTGALPLPLIYACRMGGKGMCGECPAAGDSGRKNECIFFSLSCTFTLSSMTWHLVGRELHPSRWLALVPAQTPPVVAFVSICCWAIFPICSETGRGIGVSVVPAVVGSIPPHAPRLTAFRPIQQDCAEPELRQVWAIRVADTLWELNVCWSNRWVLFQLCECLPEILKTPALMNGSLEVLSGAFRCCLALMKRVNATSGCLLCLLPPTERLLLRDGKASSPHSLSENITVLPLHWCFWGSVMSTQRPTPVLMLCAHGDG